MKLKGKKVLVVGLGKTGEAVCRFLLARGAEVKISDKKNEQELGPKISFWKERGIIVESGEHRLQSFQEVDLIIPSPGVPPIPPLQKAAEKGVRVISEIELASKFLKGKIVGITGSNGKSTTATLTHKILKEGGLPAYLAGNIGIPLISFVHNSRDQDIYITEISSFQLQYIEHFKADLAVLLNISPDHLDWHPSFTDYYQAKTKLITFQDKMATAILNRDDPLVWNLRPQIKSKVYAFSQKKKVHSGCFLQGQWLIISNSGQTRLMPTSQIPLLGSHNLENVMAAALIGYLFSIPPERISQSIKNFKGLEHRLEWVTSIRGVDFYNDSKATNVDAALKSIQSFRVNIVLILGGRDKGGNFTKLHKAIQERVKKIIVIGEAAEKIKNSLKDTVPIKEVSSLKGAAAASLEAAQPGEVVLLAPACTSFDMFHNFEERGQIFKKEVLALQRKIEEVKT